MAMYWPQGWKKDTIEFGRLILQPLGPMFQHLLISSSQCSSIYCLLGAKQQAKNAQSWTQVFLALTPSVKRALVTNSFCNQIMLGYVFC